MKTVEPTHLVPIRLAPEAWLSLTDVLPSVRMSLSTLYRLQGTGDFPAPTRVGSVNVYERHAVERWIADRKKGKQLPSFALRESRGELPKHRGILTHWLPAEGLIRITEIERETRTQQPTIQTWVRKGQFPRPLSPGVWARKQVEDWVADRKQGKPLPFSGTIPVQWATEDTEKSMQISSREFCTTTRLAPPQVYRLVSLGDFPEPICRGRYAAADVHAWIRDRMLGKPMAGTGKVLGAWWKEHCAAYPVEQQAPKMVPGRGATGRPRGTTQQSLRERYEALLTPPPGWEDQQQQQQQQQQAAASQPAPRGERQTGLPAVPAPEDTHTSGLDYLDARERQAAALATAQAWDAPPKPLSELANEWQREMGNKHRHATEPHKTKPLVADPDEAIDFDDDDLSEFE